jgi:hypothetical protein
MLVMAMTWPEASVRMTLIAAVAVVLSVLIWAIFRTGQTAIKKEIRQHEELEKLRAGRQA